MTPVVLTQIAVRALSRNTGRTLLSMLGIVIGVAAVICTVAIGEGASERVRQATSAIGVNFVWVEAGSVNAGGVRTGALGTRSLVEEDAIAIRQQVAALSACSEQVDTSVQVVHGNQNWRSTVRGVSTDYLEVRDWPVVRGQSFDQHDVERAANVCVIGQTIVDQVFPGEDPIGLEMRVKNIGCKVIGVLAPKGPSVTGQDMDDGFLMPYTAVQKHIKGQFWLDDILCSARTTADILPAEEQLTELLRRRHRLADGAPDDFNLRHPTEIAQMVADSTRTMEYLLAGIAAVSLLVGSIGIMNIMLVSVTERTREIGLRMAVGASAGAIRLQFLLEASLLCLVGGLVGCGTGIAGATVLNTYFGWLTQVTSGTITLALGVSGGIGIFFGFYPAHKAAKLDPIEALRFE